MAGLLLAACAGPPSPVREPGGEPRAAAERGLAAAPGESPASPQPPGRTPAVGDDGRARVLLPAGACETGRLELQVFDRERGAWTPHPAHPFVAAGSCIQERAERLLTDLRVRCVDPEEVRPPSPWVQGVRLDDPAEPGDCAAR